MPSYAETDAELASRLATQAGHVLLELRAEMFAAGASTWDVKDAGDALAQKFLAEELGLHRPDDAVLSEEGLEDPRRFTSDRVWIVDPARRHAGVQRTRSPRLGGTRRALDRWGLRWIRRQPAGRRPDASAPTPPPSCRR